MRSHGVPDFPDPVLTPGGGYAREIQVQQGSDLDRNSPQFQAAYAACQSLLPAPTPGQAQQIDRQRLAQALAYSQCMRAHGVADFPDPVASNGSVTVTINGLKMDTPAFTSADAACQPLMQGAPGGSNGPGGSQP